MFNLRDEIQNCQVPPLALIQEWAESIKNKSNIKCNFFQSASDVTDPRELNPEDKKLMIFDNLLLEKHTKYEFYYVRGRHSNVDCIYLSQNYFRLPRQTIRENSNFICIFKQDEKNINHIYNDHVGEDMSKEEFRKFCLKCWERLHGFAVIDLTSKAHEGKYRNGFDNFKGQILRYFDHTVFLLQSAANDVNKHVSISFHKYHPETCHKSRSNCHADVRPQKWCMADFP